VTWELPVPETPTRDQMAAFVQDYAQARGSTLSRVELIETAAGATYARACKSALRACRRSKGSELARLISRGLAGQWACWLRLTGAEHLRLDLDTNYPFAALQRFRQITEVLQTST
jgi:hypothetical protein